jgi:hypothetical protein
MAHHRVYHRVIADNSPAPQWTLAPKEMCHYIIRAHTETLLALGVGHTATEGRSKFELKEHPYAKGQSDRVISVEFETHGVEVSVGVGYMTTYKAPRVVGRVDRIELLFIQHRWYYETDIKLHDGSNQYTMMSDGDTLELEYHSQQLRFGRSPVVNFKLGHSREVNLQKGEQKNIRTGRIRPVRHSKAVVNPKIERVDGPAPAHFFVRLQHRQGLPLSKAKSEVQMEEVQVQGQHPAPRVVAGLTLKRVNLTVFLERR